MTKENKGNVGKTQSPVDSSLQHPDGGHDHEMHEMSKHDHGKMSNNVDAHVGHDMSQNENDSKVKVQTEHVGHDMSGNHDEHEDKSAHVDHSGHEQTFRKKFWISLVLSIPVLFFSPTIQSWLGYNLPEFPGSTWITPIFSVIVFLYGGLPFLEMAVPEIKNRKPGMMTLISLAIIVAFIYSIVALFLPAGVSFFWELVTLIDIMLLGHWIEMRSIR